MQETASLLTRLLDNLPPIEPFLPPSLSCAYGANFVAAAYCKLNYQWMPPRGMWQHGWISQYRAVDPAAVIGGYGSYAEVKETEYFWVARKDEEDYLQQCGYRRAKAIGLPVVYLPNKQVDRVKGSLLVMPMHSLPYTTHQWNFEAYADAIAQIRDAFTSVVVCVHQSCWQRGIWVGSFRRRGFEVIQGAGSDRNALHRLQDLFTGFEYVTTNSYGSHLVYASFFGAKVSIYGPYAAFGKSDYANTLLYQECPHILQPMLKEVAESTVRGRYPFLFCHPIEAIQNKEWGAHEVGSPCKVSPEELRRLFGWDLTTLTRRRISRKLSELRKKVTTDAVNSLRHQAKMALRKEYRDFHRNFKHVLELPPLTAGSAMVYGKPFSFVDGGSFLFLYREIIENQIYRFSTAKQIPLIIDGGANIGLSVAYFKHLYPTSTIMAFEPDPDIFRVLQQNCQSFGLENVELFREALWINDDTLKFRQEGTWGGRLSVEDECDGIVVRTKRLRDLLQQNVSLLKLDVEGAETELLEDCADLLSNVDSLFVEYHSFADRPQSLHRLLTVVHDAGFRVHFHVYEPSPQPLFIRSIRQAVDVLDMNLDIFCYRA